MSVDPVARMNLRAKGRRPDYFDDPATDRLLSMVLALLGELSVTRERLDTVERLLAASGTLDPAAVEAFAPDGEAARARGLAARTLIARVLRGVEQDMQALKSSDLPVEEVSRQLRDL